jgi:hypothetical protein
MHCAKATPDPLFVKITEDTTEGAAPGDLDITTLEIELGDTLNIAGRTYSVEPVRGEGGAFAIRGRTDDLRGNLAAYDLLHWAGVLPADCEIDDLCLRNPQNGDCLLELCHDGPRACSYDPLLQPGKRHIFVRLDGCMQNPHLDDGAFDNVVVRGSGCMFGTKSAHVVTKTGRVLSLIERSTVLDEPVERLVTRPNMSLYEREILRRLIGVITLLLRGGKVGRLVVALPRGAYYGLPVVGASLGLVSPELMLEWFDKVDERVAMLHQRYVRDIGRAARSFAVERYSFMDSACEVLRAFFRARLGRGAEPFDVQALLAEVLSAMQENDPFARYVFSSGAPRPATFQELADLTYAVTNLVEMAEPPKGRTLVVGVYDPTENIMWNAARKVRYRGLLEPRGLYNASGPQRSKLDALSYVGVMPIEQVVFDVSDEYAEQNLGGAGRLLAVQDTKIDTIDKHLITGVFGLSDDRAGRRDEEDPIRLRQHRADAALSEHAG